MATLKGKWLLNENISVPDADIEQTVTFTTSGTIDGTEYSALNCKSMLVDVSSAELLQYKVESAEPEWEWRERYDTAYCNGLLGFYGFVDQGLRYVDFGETEQAVSDAYSAWFTANAKEVGADEKIATIKAGVYRFNDVLTMPSEALLQDINFSLQYSSPDVGSGTAFATKIGVAPSDGVWCVVNATDPQFPGYELPADFVLYHEEYGGWLLEYYGADMQTITIPVDADVTEVYAEWHNANTVRIDAEEEDPVATIFHNGNAIAKVFEKQAVALRCAGKKMASDLVVAVAQSTATAPIDLSNIPEVESIENPTRKSPIAVSYNGEIYLLCEGELNNG